MTHEENDAKLLYSLLQHFIKAGWSERRTLLDHYHDVLLSEDVDPLFAVLQENLVDPSDPRVASILDDARVFLRRCRTWGVPVAWHLAMRMRLGDSIPIPRELEEVVREIAAFLSRRDDAGREEAIRRMRSLLQSFPDRPPDLFDGALLRDLAETTIALPRLHPQRNLRNIEGYLRLALPAYEAAGRSISVTRLNRQLGETLAEAGRFDEALGFLTVAVDRARHQGPVEDLAWTLASYGSVLDDLNRTEEAIAAFSEAVQLLPSAAPLWRNRAEILMHLRRLADAEADLARAVELAGNAESAHLWLRRAQLAIARGDGVEADALLDEAQRRDPTLELEDARARAAWLRGEVDRACRCLEAALVQDNPGSRAVLRRELERLFAEHPSLDGRDRLRAVLLKTPYPQLP